MTTKNEMKGQGYANLLRTSTDDQILSIGDQRKVNNAFARDLGMIHVLDLEVEGVSASKTIARWDLDDLIEAKRCGANFSIVVVHDYSRLTRGGVQHGHDTKRRLARVGLKVMSATEDLPASDEAELIESIYHYKNRLFSKNLSNTTTRARRTCLEKALHPHAATTPFGYDRMYFGADQKPTLIVRMLEGRRKVKLDPTTHEVRGYIEPDKEGRIPKFTKQEDERSVLVAGTPEKVALIQHIFREHWVNGVSIIKLTNYLNMQTNIRTFKGKVWYETSVHGMLNNPVYLGEPVACRVSKGLFYTVGAERPILLNRDEAELEANGATEVPELKRSPDDWYTPPQCEEFPLPALITDPDVRRLAAEGMAGYWKRWAENRSKEADRDSHRASKYFLKRILHSRQGDYPMSGKTCTKNDEVKWRYYHIPLIDASTGRGSVLRRLIPAEPVEEKVLDVLRETLAGADEMTSLVEKHVAGICSSKPSHQSDKSQLELEEKRVSRRITLFYETAGDGDENDAQLREVINKLKQQQQELRRELAFLNNSETQGAVDVESIREQVVSQLAEVSSKLDDLPMPQLHRLLGMLCKNMTIDLETRDFEFEVRLPSWALGRADAIMTAVGLAFGQDHQTEYQTHGLPDLKIAHFHCAYSRKTRQSPICYDCVRDKNRKATASNAAA